MDEDVMRRRLKEIDSELDSCKQAQRSANSRSCSSGISARRPQTLEVAWVVLLLTDCNFPVAVAFGVQYGLGEQEILDSLTDKLLATPTEEAVREAEFWRRSRSVSSRRAMTFIEDRSVQSWIHEQNTKYGRAPSYQEVYEFQVAVKRKECGNPASTTALLPRSQQQRVRRFKQRTRGRLAVVRTKANEDQQTVAKQAAGEPRIVTGGAIFS